MTDNEKVALCKMLIGNYDTYADPDSVPALETLVRNLRQSGTGWYYCEYGGTITPQDYCSRAERITNVGAPECVP